MIMTEKLADQIMTALFCLALSAYGNIESQWALESAKAYAQQKFIEITHEWEDGFCIEWGIIKTE